MIANNMISTRIIFIAATLISSHVLFAQDENLTILTEILSSEAFFSMDLSDEEMQARSEVLQELMLSPVNINTNRVVELAEIGLITEFQLNKLNEYKFRYGSLLSINELRFIEGWDEDTFYRLSPFIDKLNSTGKDKALVRKLAVKQKLILNAGRIIEKSRGYISDDISESNSKSHYLGSPWRFGLRYDLRMGEKISIGLRAEKDPGEKIFPYHPEYQIKMNYPDHLSGYILLNFPKLIKSVCVGDYHIRFGRGITLSTNRAYHSWKHPSTLNFAHHLLRQNTSLSEMGFFRGVAVSGEIKGINFCIFLSNRKLDPSGYKEAEQGRFSFTSFNETGYHRTQSEMERRGKIGMTTYGSIIRFSNHRLRAGLSAYVSTLSTAMKKSGRACNFFDYSGTRNYTLGGFVEIFLKKTVSYIEIARSMNNKLALMAGGQSLLSSAFTLSYSFRYFPVGFHPGFHAHGTGLSRSLSNETGLLIGIEISFPRRWKVILTMDYSRFPWISYSNNSSGNRHALYLRLSKDGDLYNTLISYSFRQGNENASNEFHYTYPSLNTCKHQFDWQHIFFQKDRFRFKGRISYVLFIDVNGETHHGSFMQNEIMYSFPEWRIAFYIGGILFNSESYSSRLYAYEPDLLYSSGNQILNGRGLRSYVLIKWSFKEYLCFRIKAAVSVYKNQFKIGSGWDEITGNKRTNVSVQLMFRL
jgi:hypothetical protein